MALDSTQTAAHGTRDAGADARRDTGAPGRNETALERADRNLAELLQEVRVAQMGVQVLFAFLLTVPFSSRFDELTSFQRHVFFVTLLAAGGAAVLLIAPTSWHRILFRCGDKEHLVRVSNRYAIAGLAFVAIAMVGVLLLASDFLFGAGVAAVVTAGVALVCAATWYMLPLRRRRALRGRDEAHAGRPEVGQGVLPARSAPR